MSDDENSVFDFPCQFPIKAMGLASDELEIIIFEIVKKHWPDLTQDCISKRASGNGKYFSVTITIEANSREQLDAIYMDLTASKHVLMAL